MGCGACRKCQGKVILTHLKRLHEEMDAMYKKFSGVRKFLLRRTYSCEDDEPICDKQLTEQELNFFRDKMFQKMGPRTGTYKSEARCDDAVGGEVSTAEFPARVVTAEEAMMEKPTGSERYDDAGERKNEEPRDLLDRLAYVARDAEESYGLFAKRRDKTLALCYHCAHPKLTPEQLEVYRSNWFKRGNIRFKMFGISSKCKCKEGCKEADAKANDDGATSKDAPKARNCGWNKGRKSRP